MKPIVAMAASCLLAYAASGVAGGLNDGDLVDKILVHPKTGQALLVLSVDLPLTDEANEHKLSHKLSTYVTFVESGQLHSKYPQAKRETPVLISLVFELPPPSHVVPKLRAMKERLVGRGWQVQLKVYDEKTNKVTDLEL